MQYNRILRKVGALKNFWHKYDYMFYEISLFKYIIKMVKVKASYNMDMRYNNWYELIQWKSLP